jgi:hypothetical protein
VENIRGNNGIPLVIKFGDNMCLGLPDDLRHHVVLYAEKFWELNEKQKFPEVKPG